MPSKDDGNERNGPFKSPLSLDISDTQSISFPHMASLHDWLKKQLASYLHLYKLGDTIGASFASRFHKIISDLTHLEKNALRLTMQGRPDTAEVNILFDLVKRTFSKQAAAPLPVADDQWHQDVIGCLRNGELQEANKLLEIKLPFSPVISWSSGNDQTYIESKPQVEASPNDDMTLKREGREKVTPTGLVMEEMRRNDPAYSDLSDAFAELQKKVGAQLSETERFRSDIGDSHRAWNELYDRINTENQQQLERIERKLSELTDSANAAIEREKLKPVIDYWGTKRRAHLFRIIGNGIALAIWLVASTCVLWRALGEYREQVRNAKDIFDLLPYLPSNVLLIGAAIWGTRVLLRQVLSENHMKTRAEEKVVLIQTYVALTKEGQATVADRNIILSSVFMPTQDGVVQDDGMPNPGFFTLNK